MGFLKEELQIRKYNIYCKLHFNYYMLQNYILIQKVIKDVKFLNVYIKKCILQALYYCKKVLEIVYVMSIFPNVI